MPYLAILPAAVDGLLVGGGAASLPRTQVPLRARARATAWLQDTRLRSIAKECQPRELDVRATHDALRADGVDLAHSGKANCQRQR